MPRHLKYAFRITHIDNIPHIIRHGFLCGNSPARSDAYINIGDSQIIEIRKHRVADDISFSDCVPFYLGPRTPMLYVIQHGYNGVVRREAAEIVYCVVRISDLVRDAVDCIFTDGHALSAITRFYRKESLGNIDNIVSYDDVYSVNWNNDADIDLKRRKEAELLVVGDLPANYICGFVVYDQQAKTRLTSYGVPQEKVVIAPNYYF